MKIWQKYILGRLATTFLFFLVCLLVVYVLIDLSAHGVRFFSKSSFLEIAIFYLYSFAALLDLFVTLTFLLATMRVLITLNTHREIVALQMAGLSKKKLLTPFFFFAAILSTLCYLNLQWFAQNAQELTNNFRSLHKTKKVKSEKIGVYTVSLEDQSEIVYRKFDPKKQELSDVFWIRSPNDFWHMKTFQLHSLEGKYVNHLTRNSSKQLEKSESFETFLFSELPWKKETVLQRFVPYESRSISTLFSQACSRSAERRSIFSHLYYKLIVPLTPFLVLFALTPVLLRYTRNWPIFLTTAYSLFGFIALKVILDGMLILGENQVVPSYVAILGPFLLILCLFIPRFAKLY